MSGLGVKGAERRRTDDIETVPIHCRKRLNDRTHFLDQTGDVDRFEIEGHLARLDLRQIEDVVDQPEEMTAGVADLCEIGQEFVLPLVLRGLVQHLAVADDRSSLGASRAMPDYGFIGASKAALESLVRTLAQELGPRHIRVNAVSAGVVDTDALRYFPNRQELLANFAQRTPAGPVLTPQDVAGAVYLLCLPEAAMITGHTLVVDGGFCISG